MYYVITPYLSIIVGFKHFETRRKAMDHIQNAVLQYPELAERYAKLGQLFDRK